MSECRSMSMSLWLSPSLFKLFKPPVKNYLIAVIIAFVALVATSRAAFCETWPARPVTVIVPFPPGGNTDLMARLLSQKLSGKFGQPFIVDNRVGASGLIGARDVARASPDGYTLMFCAFQQMSVLPVIEKANYDPETDFTYISIFGDGPFVLAVNRSVPVTNLQEFIEYSKKHPGELSYASGGVFSGAHLVPALFFSRAGIELNHVPYRGGGPAIADFLGDHVQVYFGNASELIPIATNPGIRILATSTLKRMPQLPDVPTISEIIPGFAFTSWNGLLAPAGIPDEVRQKLEQATIDAARDPQVIKTLSDVGISAVGDTSAEFRSRVAQEAPLLGDAIKAAQASAK
jgi:tripartite-type tricarboxylate transporter receptor subunit TctC